MGQQGHYAYQADGAPNDPHVPADDVPIASEAAHPEFVTKNDFTVGSHLTFRGREDAPIEALPRHLEEIDAR
jgi:hypothetical protein